MATISIVRQAVPEQRLGWKAVSAGERIAAAALLAAASPLLAGAAIATMWVSGRAPFILHRRVGHLGKPLWILKLRTMWGDGAAPSGAWLERIEDDTGPAAKRRGDTRVTSRLAAFFRRHSIDELPQLWHVVRGEMALIGPRPLTQREIRDHYAGFAAELLSVKPGIAGLWQTSGRNRLSYAERRRLDLEFVRGRSAWMYARIVARTFTEIWSGANTW